MKFEIERKFLVTGEFKHLAKSRVEIAQGYLSSDPNRTVRIRKYADKAFLTIKGKSDPTGMKRFEWEKEIKTEDAEQLLEICEKGKIVKTRYLIEHDNHLFEVDEFKNENSGLIIAEVELESIDEEVILPDWIGKEVTNDSRYYNSHLSKHPFTDW